MLPIRHHVVVAGAGYAGLTAARRLARRAPDGVSITLVNAAPWFLERVRLHQVAAGQQIRMPLLRDIFSGTRVELIMGRVIGLDPEHQRLWVNSERGHLAVPYDTLVNALGSRPDLSVPGAADHALVLSGAESAERMSATIARLAARRGDIAVVGGGATGIETATELAETHPALQVRLVTRDEPGAWLSARARAHIDEVLGRLGVAVHTGRAVTEVGPDSIALEGERTIAIDATVWAAGLRATNLAQQVGIDVDTTGRIVVDSRMRSVSHHDVYAVGDTAAVRAPDGSRLRMGCTTAIPAGRYVADELSAQLRGIASAPWDFQYHAQTLSLGRRSGVLQRLQPDSAPTPRILTGWSAARAKELMVRRAGRRARSGGSGIRWPA